MQLSPVTPEDLHDYLTWAFTTKATPEGYGFQAPAEEYVEAIRLFIERFVPILTTTVDQKLPEDALERRLFTIVASSWMTGFGMGREYAARQRDLSALRAR